jgi:NAD(P)-dependent dehydrogenase (short-subunit alcohol dehydrogenase family)
MKNCFVIVTVVLLTALAITVASAQEASTERKAVLVTGATSGIGLKITEKLAGNGFYVYAGARKDEDMKRLNAMDNTTAVRIDVTKQDQIDAAVAFVESQGRGLWGVVNNAGVAVYSPLTTGPESEFDFTFNVNVYGPFRVNQAFLPLLTKSGGRTTTISSISGFIAGPGSYSMSKFAVEGYTDSLAAELTDSGVHVSVVEPGGFRSEIVENLIKRAELAEAEGELEISEELRTGLAKSAESRQTLKEPDEVAAAVLELMMVEQPKRRYMVTPNEEQADMTIRASMQRLLELNEAHAYSKSRDELVELLDELLTSGGS